MLLKIIYSLTLFALAASQEDSGCIMDKDSALMKCLGDYASVPPVASTTGSVEQAAELCAIHTKLAGCWAEGTYCREWLPMQTAADKLCALANSTSSATITSAETSPTISISLNVTTVTAGNTTTVSVIPPSTTTSRDASATAVSTDVPSATLESVVAEASRVVTSIWNNDSGTDIPVVSNDVGTQTRPTWTKAGETSPGQTASATGVVGSSTNPEGAAISLHAPLVLAIVPGLIAACFL